MGRVDGPETDTTASPIAVVLLLSRFCEVDPSNFRGSVWDEKSSPDADGFMRLIS